MKPRSNKTYTHSVIQVIVSFATTEVLSQLLV